MNTTANNKVYKVERLDKRALSRHLPHVPCSLKTFLLLFALCIMTTSCHDSQSVGVPEITGVRKTNPQLADSLFSQSVPGQMIIILGNNLQHARHIYINDQEVRFNPTENTDHSIIVTIPTEENGFVLTAFDSRLTDEIRVETDGGTAHYSFKVLCPKPVLQRISGKYPRNQGIELSLYGLNLIDVQRVYFTDVPFRETDSLRRVSDNKGIPFSFPGNKTEVTQYSVSIGDHYLNERTKKYETSCVMQFSLPNISYNNGTMVVECASGTSYVEYSALPPKPVIASLSSDMPVTGERVTITGRNFVVVKEVAYGDIVIPASQIYVSPSEDTLSFVMGALPHTTTSNLKVTTLGGEDEIPFYDYRTLLIDFDGRGTDMGHSPNCFYASADGSAPPYTSSGTFAHFYVQDNGSNWWGQMFYFRAGNNEKTFSLPSYDVIPAQTPADDILLTVECYNNGTVFNNTALIYYYLQTQNKGNLIWQNWNNNKYKEPVLADINGNTFQNQWYRAVIPMSHFAAFADNKTYQDIVEAGLTHIRFMEHNYTNTPLFIDVFFDNVRIIKRPYSPE